MFSRLEFFLLFGICEERKGVFSDLPLHVEGLDFIYFFIDFVLYFHDIAEELEPFQC